tara:strand:+ start:1227 stop:1538 length:312 start_codon:yes stop_codon:yes gene_type:complete
MRKRSWPNRKNRKCPTCKKMLTYSRKDAFDRAVGNNSVCKSCAHMDRKFTLETLEKMKKPKTQEHRQKISLAHYKNSYNNFIQKSTQFYNFDEYVKLKKSGRI